jgi:hypothetical protein
VPSSFAYVTGVDPWGRQRGESAEQHDWFTHWRNDGHRRAFTRTAEKFRVTAARVAGAAKRNEWSSRLAAWKAANSRQVQERYADLAEQALVPFVQAAARLAAHAATVKLDKLPADRALVAATGALRLVKEPDVAALIRISASAGADARELDVLDRLLDRLAESNPAAHDAVLDALHEATEAEATAGQPVDQQA